MTSRVTADLTTELRSAVAFFGDDLRWAITAVPAEADPSAVVDHYDTAALDAESLLRRAVEASQSPGGPGLVGSRAAIDDFFDHCLRSLLRPDLVAGVAAMGPQWRGWSVGVTEAIEEIPDLLHRLNGAHRRALEDHLQHRRSETTTTKRRST